MVIGIGGLSRSGKTTLSYKIREWFGPDKALILHQDTYVKDEKIIPRIKNRIDWEHPKSLDFKELKSLILKNKSKYSVIIVEGLMVFYDAEIYKLFTKKIYIKISETAFLERKKDDNRWGKEPEWYIRHIWQSHFKYGLLPKSENSTLLIDGELCCEDEKVKKFLGIDPVNEFDF
jgi:nicotinamide/nicotinate riboside kinase